MPSSWPTLRAALESVVHRHAFIKEFEALRKVSELPPPSADPVALLDRLHDRSGDPDQKNALLRSLVRAAQSGQAEAETAITLLHLALWPGLDHARARLRRFFRGEPEELTAAICAEFNRQIGRLPLDRVNRIAATIVRNVERDVTRRRMKELSRRAVCDAFDEEELIAASAPCVQTRLADAHDEDGLRRLEEQVARLIGRDAALVIEIAVRGAPQKEAAETLGLSHDVARKRYQRALARLRAALAA